MKHMKEFNKLLKDLNPINHRCELNGEYRPCSCNDVKLVREYSECEECYTMYVGIAENKLRSYVDKKIKTMRSILANDKQSQWYSSQHKSTAPYWALNDQYLKNIMAWFNDEGLDIPFNLQKEINKRFPSLVSQKSLLEQKERTQASEKYVENRKSFRHEGTIARNSASDWTDFDADFGPQ